MNDVFLIGGPLNVQRFELSTLDVLSAAVVAASETHWETIRSPHLLMGLMAKPDDRIIGWCSSLETTPFKLLNQFKKLFLQATEANHSVKLHREFCSTNTIQVLRNASSYSQNHGHSQIRPCDLLWALLCDDGCVSACFAESGYSASVLRVLLGEIVTDSGTTDAFQSL